MAASVEEIRARFPALERRCAGRPAAYFDGPGGTQVPAEVADAVREYLLRHNANTGWAYPSSAETDRILAEARGALADFLNASPDEIAFGANMTTLTLHLSRAIGRTLGPGDEVVVTELDHHADIDPWREMARDVGLTVRTAPMVPESGTLDMERLRELIGPSTAVVAVGAASNALGTVNDLERIGRWTRAAGALLFVDAVHSAPHVLPDVAALECDFLACSPYKFYGPHLGVLYGRRDRVEALPIPRLVPAHDRAPERLETGTLSHEGIAGAAAAVDFLASLGEGGSRRDGLVSAYRVLEARGEDLLRRMWEGLAAVPGVTLYGPPPGEPRTPTVGFSVRGVPSREVARRLADDHGVFVSHGDFYAATVVERLGMAGEGLVRAGCACYTTVGEVERLVEGVGVIAGG
ncbi:MAG TPA: cysteine desulfurase-like protein [Gemmatimonadota bacterium]|nr:cysteine desulfurase-like protein [Gemmatimonadota bacterium]